MSFLDALQAVEAEYQSVVYAPAKTVEQLRELFYSERISAEKVTKKNRVNASKHEIFGVVRFLKSIDSQKYTARELTEMVEKQSDLTYQVTPPKRFWCKNNPESCLTHFDSHYQTILSIIRLTIVMPKSQRY